MKVFDCFLFFNELDLLELRLNVLNDCVDYFVIVESAVTFQGEDKEYCFEKNRNRFAKFENKIIYFKVEKYVIDFANLQYITAPQTVDQEVLNRIYKFIDACHRFDKQKEFWWGNDFFQRECIGRALALAKPAPNDLILLSDVDEIPSPAVVTKIKETISPQSLLCLRQHEFCYYLNYYHNSDWVGTCCFLYGAYAHVSLNAIRFSTKRDEGLAPTIVGDGGWHFTSLGGVDAIKKKIKSWGHRELNTRAILNGVEYNVRHGYDIFRRPGFGRLVSLPLRHVKLPPALLTFRERFPYLIGPEIEPEHFPDRLFYSAFFFTQSKMSAIWRRLSLLFPASRADS